MCDARYDSNFTNIHLTCEVEGEHEMVTDAYGTYAIHRAARTTGSRLVGRRYFTDVYEAVTEPFTWDDHMVCTTPATA